jgi:hypothetical protein
MTQLRKQKNILYVTATIIAAIFIVATTFAAITVNKTLSSTGNIITSTNIGVYSDSACNNEQTTIDWGSTSPGSSITRTIYVKNTGSGTNVALSLTTLSWNPTNANGPITISWDRQGTTLTPGQSTDATITLSVSSSIAGITSFSFNIQVTGTS